MARVAVLAAAAVAAFAVAADALWPAGASTTDSGERRVIGRSVDGRAIRAVRVGDPAAERVALAVGVIHGDERAGLAITRELRRLGSGIDAQVWVIDSLNPDGARARTRRNANGVDLNRNFPYRWRGGVPQVQRLLPWAEPGLGARDPRRYGLHSRASTPTSPSGTTSRGEPCWPAAGGRRSRPATPSW